jgi:hypothetical protein
MNYRLLIPALVMGWLLTGSHALGADETDTSRRTQELAVDARIDLKGKLEQVRAEEELLKKVTAKTVPPAVKKDIAIARLTIQARTAKQRKEHLQEEAKKTPSDVSLALDLIDATSEERQLTAERDALKESKDGPDSKDFRVKRLKIQADSLSTRLDAIRKRREEEKDKGSRALLAERIQLLEAQLERVKAEREALEKR